MFEVKNFDNWSEYEGLAAGSGRSEKVWLMSESGEIGLFKYPKFDSDAGDVTSEHVSEHLAHQLGELIGISTAIVDIGTRNGRIGSMSYLAREKSEALVEGIGFISGKYPSYNAETMYDENNKNYYCIEHIVESVPNVVVPTSFWIEMMLFDFLIGNADRHQGNWAVLVKALSGGRKGLQVRPCPLYDNGSSLCSYIKESSIDSYVGNDKLRFNALVDTKSRSMIRIEGKQKKLPTHLEMAEYLIKTYPEAKTFSKMIVKELKKEVITTLLNKYTDNVLSKKKKKLIELYLLKKLELLHSLLGEGDML